MKKFLLHTVCSRFALIQAHLELGKHSGSFVVIQVVRDGSLRQPHRFPNHLCVLTFEVFRQCCQEPRFRVIPCHGRVPTLMSTNAVMCNHSVRIKTFNHRENQFKVVIQDGPCDSLGCFITRFLSRGLRFTNFLRIRQITVILGHDTFVKCLLFSNPQCRENDQPLGGYNTQALDTAE